MHTSDTLFVALYANEGAAVTRPSSLLVTRDMRR